MVNEVQVEDGANDMSSRPVTELDFRMPKFRDAKPEDYEFREDGALVRKDRWETGIHKIRSILGDSRREFEIDDIIRAVEALVEALPPLGQDEAGFGL